MDKKTEQLNILLNGIKKVVSNKNCPEWVARYLTVTVKNAKELNPNAIKETSSQEPEIEVEETYRPFEINDKVASNISGDTLFIK